MTVTEPYRTRRIVLTGVLALALLLLFVWWIDWQTTHDTPVAETCDVVADRMVQTVEHMSYDLAYGICLGNQTN